MTRLYFTTSGIIQTDPRNPAPETIAKAAHIIEAGGIVIIPTLGLYGIAADAFNPMALQKIFELKNRPETNPLLIFVKDIMALENLVTEVSPSARKLMARFWPGKLTLIFKAQNHLPSALTSGTGKIGIRLPGHPVTSTLVRALKIPITGTSANFSGQPGCHEIQSLPDSILNKADLILDAGTLQGGPGSTVVDTTVHPVRIIREGAIPAHEIFKTLA
jgi:L-threonylcarbamoyladenylate synthase